MRLSDFTNIDRAAGFLIKLIIAMFVLMIAADVVGIIFRQLTLPDALLGLLLLVLSSPIAYLIREHRRPRRPEHARRGAERTPVLPITEHEE